MADENDAAEKTEDPTQKRLDDAHDRGDVAKSQEVNTWFMIAGATLVLSTFSGSIGGGIMMPLRNVLANSWMIHADGPGLQEYIGRFDRKQLQRIYLVHGEFERSKALQAGLRQQGQANVEVPERGQKFTL